MKENPYQVPPNFFEKQKAEILSVVSQSPQKKKSVFSLKKMAIFSLMTQKVCFIENQRTLLYQSITMQ